MIKSLVIVAGWLCAHTPEWLLHAIAVVLGRLLYWGYASRRRLMLASLRLSFPERNAAWVRKTAHASCQRLIETGLMSLAAPFFTAERIRGLAAIGDGFEVLWREYRANPRPFFLGAAHFAYWESLPWLPLFVPTTLPDLIGIYRPLRNPVFDAWVRRSRERFGVRFLSRRGGLHAALHTLKSKGGVCILIDQNAGSNGVLTAFLGRECSTTPLPGMLVERTGAQAGLLYSRRTAFWRFTIHYLPVAHDGTAASVTLGLNRELEALLRGDDDLCASWLWLHHRWKILQQPEELARLRAKRGTLKPTEE